MTRSSSFAGGGIGPQQVDILLGRFKSGLVGRLGIRRFLEEASRQRGDVLAESLAAPAGRERHKLRLAGSWQLGEELAQARFEFRGERRLDVARPAAGEAREDRHGDLGLSRFQAR